MPAIVGRSEAGPDTVGHYCNNKATIFVAPSVPYTLSIVNSTVSDWFARQTFSSKQGGFLDYEPRYSGTIPIPSPRPEQERAVTLLAVAILAGAARPRLESLLNAFVYELFFPDELAARGLSPFAAAREAGLDELAGLTGKALARAADTWSAQLADPATRLYATLFDLQSIDAIRIIEGRG